MAGTENMPDVPIQKNSKIVVNIDEALPDILVVTYEYGSKTFQGVLLDSTKRNLPYGVSNLNPAYSNPSEKGKDGEDKLYSASQRFAYQEGVSSTTKEFNQKRSVRLPARYKNAKMTVRLRPRQVLCSKCRGICNENSENVDNSRKRKANDEEPTRQQPKRDTRTSKPLSSDSQSNEQQQRMCLRLEGPSPSPSEEADGEEMDAVSPECQERVQPLSQPEFKTPSARKDTNNKGKRLKQEWEDESELEAAHNTRTIKISFGREGEGTVLKIPAKIEDLSSNEQKVRTKDASSKAARRALKKAKKEARRKFLVGSSGSPCYTLGGGTSPRYTLGGGTSPRYTLGGGGSPRYGALETRRHKHKHKKKHREDRRAAHTDEPAEDMKERCLKQKLSINLKRLSSSAYKPLASGVPNGVTTPECSEGDGEGEGEVDGEDTAPDFPPVQPFTMHVTAQTVSGVGADGRRLSVGDVVWGKIHGFPWWPGKVLTITGPDAHVAWYGSSTSSLMPCQQLSPFLENFKIRYNKKKRGPYKEAIKQATCEAKIEAPPLPAAEPALTVGPALASPREIDVVS